jgi:hypothetical protein
MQANKEIFQAIEKARANGFQQIKKSGSNPMFKSKYSTLLDVFDACKKPLEDNGVHIAFNTELHTIDGKLENVLVCRLIHLESGQFLESKVTCFDDQKKGSQAIGSGITYMRRYLLQAMLNLECDPETDDDGNSTTVEKKDPPKQSKPLEKDTVAALEEMADKINGKVEEEAEDGKYSQDQLFAEHEARIISELDLCKEVAHLRRWGENNKVWLDKFQATRKKQHENILAYFNVKKAQLKPEENNDG